jgi:hypothetical protein
MLTLRKIENVPTGPNNRPKLVVKITGTFVLIHGLAMIEVFVYLKCIECGEM